MRIGPIQLPAPFCQAGLAGYSDRAMRVVARRRGCAYAVTEALLDVILCNGGEGLRKSIDINDEDHPIAGQIIGSEPDTMAKSAGILAQAGYDVIDLNFACPVKKIKNKARGGHMLLDVERAAAVMTAVRDRVTDRPLTVSLRRAYDDSPEATDRFFEVIEMAWSLGFAAARVHARTVQQKYIGSSRWPFLSDLKRKYPTKTIFGAGDVFTAEDAVRMYRETGVDMVWIARGAIGNPWIFQHAARLLDNPDAGISPPTIAQQREALIEHFQIAAEIHGESLAARRMRKMGIKYSRFHPLAGDVKREFIQVQSLRDWHGVLDRWYGNDGPGVWPNALAADEVNSCDIAQAS
ncbi:MAG TPA: tRNA-dihydrouridine synthase [Tepidisphaeraceae bacterium]|nr:tRNA-dihydrouridine synthase [Tepidisphaeraceae bacterium]